MAKRAKGINARAWFYSQSFVSSAQFPETAAIISKLKAELKLLERAEPSGDSQQSTVDKVQTPE